jgi:hypothetical protein
MNGFRWSLVQTCCAKGALLITFFFVVGIAEAQTATLLLFGGKNNRTFLGCLTCGRYDASSVCNRFGEHGNKFSGESIWNKFGTYGSKFSAESPWNKFSTDAPAIVDENGGFYGYFSSNKFMAKRTTIKFFLAFLDNADEVNSDLERARDLFCE